MPTASGYSDHIEEVSARRVVGSASGGASGGGASRSSSSVVLARDQTEELRDVLNASVDIHEVRLENQPDGGVRIAHSLGDASPPHQG